MKQLTFLTLLCLSHWAMNISGQSNMVNWGHDLFGDQLPNGVRIDTSYGFYAYTQTGDSLFLDVFAETRAVAVDLSQNSIDISDYQGSYYEFPSFSLVQLAPNGVIINKRNAQGNLLWTKYMKGAQAPIGWAVATDSADQIIICGQYGDSLDVNPDSSATSIIHSAAGYEDNGFIVKLTPSGDLIYGLNITSTDELRCYDMKLDKTNNIYVVGTFMGTADFNPGTGIANETATGNAENLFVLKLDAQGNYLWHHVSQTSHFSRAYKCAVDDSGAVYAVGEFSNDVDFSGIGTDVRTGQGSYDAFIFKLDEAGNYQWARNYGNSNFEYIRAAHFDGKHLVVSGYFQDSLNIDPGQSNLTVNTSFSFSSYVQKIDPQGNQVWGDEVGTGRIEIRDITSNAIGDITLAGYANSQTTFNLYNCPDTLSNQGRDVLALTFDSTNTRTWVKVWNSPGDDWANGITTVNPLERLIAGTFIKQLDLDTTGGSFLYGEGNGYEGFILKNSKCYEPIHLVTVTCDSYTSPSGKTWRSSGLYYDTIFNSRGCDTIYTIDLNLGQSSQTTLTTSACESYLSPAGKQYTTSGSYIDTLTNGSGCDSLITINLTINTRPDTAVNYTGDSLTAQTIGANYQWLDCANFWNPIPGATDAYYIPTSAGSYAVQIERNGCVDTSSCYVHIVSGVEDQATAPIRVFPNPVVGDYVWVELDHSITELTVQLLDPLGRLVWSKNLTTTTQVAIPAKGEMYFLRTQLAGGEVNIHKLIRE